MAESRIGQTLAVMISGKVHEVECISENARGDLYWTTEDCEILGKWSTKLWDISRVIQGRAKAAKEATDEN